MKSLDRLLLGCILLAVFFYFSIENRAFSERLGHTLPRNTDEFAFQIALHRQHLALQGGRLGEFFGRLDFGYGNLFWTIYGLLTFPLFLWGNSSALIFGARQVSLLFMLGSVVLLWKCLQALGASRAARFTAIAIYLAQEAFTASATRFHTYGTSIFFALFATYFLVRSERLTRGDVYRSAVFAGLCFGIKLSGVFFLPFPLLYLALSQWFASHEGVKQRAMAGLTEVTRYLAIFLFVGILASSPLFFWPPSYRYLQEVLAALAWVLPNASLAYGAAFDNTVAGRWVVGFEAFYFKTPAWIMFAGLSLYAALKTPRRLLFCSLLMTHVLALVYFVFVFRGVAWKAIYFYIHLAPLLLLSLAALATLRPNIAVPCLIAIALSVGWGNGEGRRQSWLQYSHFEKSPGVQKLFAESVAMEKFFPNRQTPFQLLQHYGSVSPYSPLDSKVKSVLTYDDSRNYQEGKFDYIVLYHQARALRPEEELQRHSDARAILDERNCVKKFVDSGRFGSSRYRAIWSGELLALYQLESPQPPHEISTSPR